MIINKWKMTCDNHENLDCEVPCSLYGTLLKHGLMEDPYYGINEKKYTELCEKDCYFSSEIDVTNDILAKEYVYLNFYGLDTVCDIYVNDKKIDSVNDMFRFYSYDVKDVLAVGKNEIKLYFRSPIHYVTELNNKHYIWNNADTVAGAAHLRKSICMFGWDWAPKLPDMGIYRNVELDAYDTDKIDDVFAYQNHSDGSVKLDFTVETKHNKDAEIYINIDGQRVKAENGKAEITINNPKLWWVRGYGEQPLYDVKTELVYEGKVIDEKITRIGLRTLSLSIVNGRFKDEFCFVNNGVKIFSFGANYVPQDSILAYTSPERNRKLIESCVDANFNCIRIWGGGYYPEDDLYDLCDEAGIFVWQDFMTACYGFWLTEEYKENYIQEAIYNIKRFRNHASLGLFCGNNELERNIKNAPQIGTELVKQDYIELFERILPDLCEKYAPQTFYWPSSPSAGGGYHDVENEEIGDTHFYSPFSDYGKHKFKFCSEYGFQSFPAMKTMKSVGEEDDMNPFSLVAENHQKSSGGNRTIIQYISDNYLLPYNFEDIVYASQLFQANAIGFAVKYFRSLRPVCMGSIYWQLNDCWPCASWSSVDYFGRYKALHYYAKRFYAPVALGVFRDGNKIRVNLANETRNDFCGKVVVSLRNAENEIIKSETVDVSTNALTSEDVFAKEIIPCDIYTNYVDVKLYDIDGNLVSKQTEMYVKCKHFKFKKPEITVEFEKLDAVNTVCYIKSGVFAKDVYLDFDNFDIIFSENFFDITDKDVCEITFKTEKTVEDLKENIRIKTVYEIGQNK